MESAATYPILSDKWRDESLHGPGDFLAGARNAGWDPGPIPIGAVFTFDRRAMLHAESRDDAVEAPELAPGNARVFRIGDAIVSCLSPGAGAMVTQLENLAHLGTRRFVIAGTAGSISTDVGPGQLIVATAAVRDDGISQHYVAPARYATPSEALTERLLAALHEAIAGTTWTVPVPYRATARELATYAAEGVVAVEMEVAALFAVAQSIGVEAAAVLAITDVTTPDDRVEDWPASADPLRRALDAALDVVSRVSAAPTRQGAP